MKNKFLALFGLLMSSVAWSQGCSDAGICSINKGFTDEKKEFKNNLEYASIYSLGEADVRYLSHYLSYSKRFNERFAFTSKVTLSTANGSFGTRTQFGDAFLIGNYTFKEKKNKQWSAILGAKFPFTASNLKISGISLPLDYQSSLGTIDGFVGNNLTYKRWDFNAALQSPVSNLNKNSYFAEYSGRTDFPSTNLFERQPDALLRATYSWSVPQSKFTLKPNILFIYHLGEDSYENIFGQRENIQGSDGLTVNGNLVSTYRINPKNQLELSIASPFVVREVRPDGLTRSLVIALQYRYSF